MGYARGSGKSVLLLQLAQAGQKVLYIAAEEFGRSTFAENLRDFRIEHKNLMFCKNLNESIFSDFDIIFIDSVNSAGINLEVYRKMGEKWAKKVFVLIVQATKDGDFRGGKDWEHEVDVAGEVIHRTLIMRKHRLDPNSAAKSEKLHRQEIINQAQQKARHPEIKNPIDFVKDVCQHFDSIGIDSKTGKYCLIKRAMPNQICVVEFGIDKQHYTVTTAFREKNNRKKRKELYPTDHLPDNPSPSLGSALQHTKNKEGFRGSVVTRRKSSFGTKLSKPNKKTNLAGVVSAASLKGISYAAIPLSGHREKMFGKLHSDTQVMVWGMSGSGKSVPLLQLAQALAQAGQKVLYIAAEEFGRSTFAEKLRDFRIEHKNLMFCKNFNESIFSDFDIIFIDSVNSAGINLEVYRKMREKWTTKVFVLIVQATKDGDFRGGKDWEHEVDVAGEVINRTLIMRKHRLDPNSAAKSEKLRRQEIINQAQQKVRHPEIKNPIDFVKDVCQHFDSLGIDVEDKKSGKYWLIKRAIPNQICVVEFGLIKQLYTVTTAFREKNNRKKRKELFLGDPSPNNPSPSLGSALQHTKNKEGFRSSEVTRRKSPFGTKLSKPNKKTNLAGVVSAASLKGISYAAIPLSGQWKKMFGELHSDTQVMVWGMPAAAAKASCSCSWRKPGKKFSTSPQRNLTAVPSLKNCATFALNIKI